MVAAGNNGDDAGNWSPARAEKAFTVGGINEDWNFVPRSNHGPELDILAPANEVYSAWADNDTAYKSDSGTSMASPHVAGVAAYLMALEDKSAAEIKQRILELATSDAVTNSGDSPNKLVSGRHEKK